MAALTQQYRWNSLLFFTINMQKSNSVYKVYNFLVMLEEDQWSIMQDLVEGMGWRLQGCRPFSSWGVRGGSIHVHPPPPQTPPPPPPPPTPTPTPPPPPPKKKLWNLLYLVAVYCAENQSVDHTRRLAVQRYHPVSSADWYP